MSLFNRKKKKNAWNEITSDERSERVTPQKCDHKWQDFPWYIDSNYYFDSRTLELEIIEPYVCVKCKKRKNVVLSRSTRCRITWDEATDIVKETQEKFKDKLLTQTEVEDKINDFIMVDRDYLHGYHLVHGLKDPSVSTKQEDKINLKK